MVLNAPALEAALDQIVTEAFGVSSPSVLYHYTTWEGLAGILKTRRFWSSAHDCMNDPAELISASAVIREVARDARTNAQNELVVIALNTFIRNYEAMQVSKQVPTYLTCFSIARDDPEQWRKYGNDGRGVCIGVRVLDEQQPENPGLALSLLKVDYSESSWHQHVRTFFGRVCDIVAMGEETVETVAQGASALFRIAALEELRAKQAQWEVEREFRIAAFGRDKADPRWTTVDVKERQSGDRNIRYVEILVRQEGQLIALDEIMIGPNQDSEAGRARAMRILAEADYSERDSETHPRITVSELTWGDASSKP